MKRKVVVEVVVYDTNGADDGIVKEFGSLKEALDYVFEELEGRQVELTKTSTGEYVFVSKGGENIEYQISEV